MFSVPSGRAGKAFVSELAWLFQSYAEGSALECIALTAAMILPPFLLQKLCPKSKAREHSKCLERRLKIWKAGDILSLLVEGRTIQSRLPKLHPSNTNQEHTARAFAKLMFHGRTRAALRLLTEQSVGQVLHLDNCIPGGSNNAPLTVCDVLLSKHPSGRPVSTNALYNVTAEPPSVHPVVNPQRACAARVTVVVLCVCVCVRGPHLQLAQLSDKVGILAVSVSCSLVFKFGVFRTIAFWRS